MRSIRKADVRFSVADRAEYREFWDWYETETWEPETIAIFGRFLRPDTHYVDLGAWIGSTVLLAAPHVSRVVCAEPDPVAFAVLTENLSLNPETAAKTVAVQAAVGPSDGTVALTSETGGGDSNSSVVRPGDAGARWTAEQVSFATLLSRAGIPGADFVKIDTEGAEYELVPSLTTGPTLYIAFHPNLLVDKRSLATRLTTSVRALRANHRMLRSLFAYRHHLVFDEPSRTFRDIRMRNVLRVIFPLPLRASFLIGACVFTNEPPPQPGDRGDLILER